jgi:hypothetical protein
MMPVFHRAGLRLLLPLRIPYPTEGIDAFHLELLREAMSADLGISLDIHPHRLGREFDPRTLLRWIRFDVRLIRFVYELELGNRLVDIVLAPWFKILPELGFSGSVLFCPIVSQEHMFLEELVFLKELLSRFDKCRIAGYDANASARPDAPDPISAIQPEGVNHA